MVLANPGLPTKNQNFLPWLFGAHTLRIGAPTLVMCHSSVLHSPQAGKWYSHQTRLSWTCAWGKLEKGQGYSAMGNPKPNIWP